MKILYNIGEEATVVVATVVNYYNFKNIIS